MWPWRKVPREGTGPPTVVPVQATDSAERVQLALLNRAHQQAAVAALGQQALTGVDIATLLEHATMFVGQTFAADLVVIQQFEAGGCVLRTVALSGLKSEWLGKAISVSPGSMARAVLDSAEPLIVKNLRAANQFEVPEFLRASGALSGISLAIQVSHQPWGILHAYSRRVRSFGEDDFHFLQTVANVISTAYERRQSEEQSAKLAAFAQHNPNPVLEFSEIGTLTYFNDATRTLTDKLARNDPVELLPPNHAQLVQDCLKTKMNVLDVAVEIAGRTVLWSYFPIVPISRVHAYATDATERLNLEAQLRQSQKMEAIGQLAAGVAHDFNNILTIMQGLARKLSTPDCDRDQTVEQLFDTTERAAALTRQLLAFSRRQVIQRRVLDVRELVSGTSRMLQRLIGEDIVLTVINANTLPAIEADASMIEQILLNLAVNARDAMARGGQLLISTDQAVLPDSPTTERHYVCIQVQDTGCGMTAEVKARIFEPFFTTKEVGKGTGLGLATVFGIVKQHGGIIEVESEVGRGTTFSILLPATTRQPEASTEASIKDANAPTTGSETILLVEDEPLLRELAQAVLSGAGYNVLQAGESEEALTLWSEHQEEIDLLLTDLVLPGGLNGRDLALQLQQRKPRLKIVYTTGYSSDVAEGGHVPSSFLQKPYPPEALTRTVRACLDAPVPSK